MRFFIDDGVQKVTFIGRCGSVEIRLIDVEMEWIQGVNPTLAEAKVFPCKYFYRTGSELFIIEPEYVEWDDKEELYPIVFESQGDWEVTAALSPPEGLVADHDSLTAQVNTEVQAVQFTITDVGTKWSEPTEVTYSIKHKKKIKKIKGKVYQKLSKKKAKKLGRDIYGHKIKKQKKKEEKKKKK